LPRNHGAVQWLLASLRCPTLPRASIRAKARKVAKSFQSLNPASSSSSGPHVSCKCSGASQNSKGRWSVNEPARDRGVKVGRPAKLSRHQQEKVIRTVRDGSKTAADAARL